MVPRKVPGKLPGKLIADHRGGGRARLRAASPWIRGRARRRPQGSSPPRAPLERKLEEAGEDRAGIEEPLGDAPRGAAVLLQITRNLAGGRAGLPRGVEGEQTFAPLAKSATASGGRPVSPRPSGAISAAWSESPQREHTSLKKRTAGEQSGGGRQLLDEDHARAERAQPAHPGESDPRHAPAHRHAAERTHHHDAKRAHVTSLHAHIEPTSSPPTATRAA